MKFGKYAPLIAIGAAEGVFAKGLVNSAHAQVELKEQGSSDC